MKFTSEDLMKAIGLQVGDRIKIDNKIFEIYISPLDDIRCGNIHNANNHFNITKLIDQNIEILPRPKRVGDLKCGTKGKDGQNTCGDCPVRIICNHHACKELGCSNTLYEYLETYKTNLFEDDKDNVYDFDQEIYDLLKARLDKEVK